MSRFGANHEFPFELPLRPKAYPSYPVVSTAPRAGPFGLVVGRVAQVFVSPWRHTTTS